MEKKYLKPPKIVSPPSDWRCALPAVLALRYLSVVGPLSTSSLYRPSRLSAVMASVL